MKKTAFLLPFLLLLVSFAGVRQNGNTKNMKINYMLQGYFTASSCIPDTSALGGYAPSANQPKKMIGQISQVTGKIHLIIDTNARTTFAGKYNGYKVYISNCTDTMAAFEAADSRLSVVAEALQDSLWKPVEHLAPSWYANSYHRVFLRQGYFWEFAAPVYEGEIKTKLRYCLTGCGKRPIYSNEIPVSVNPGQFIVRPKYYKSKG